MCYDDLFFLLTQKKSLSLHYCSSTAIFTTIIMKIGIDLGGTNIRAGLVEDSKIIRQESMPCPSTDSAEIVLQAISTLISRIMIPAVSSIGIGVPSLVDSVRGIVYNATNIPSWQEVHIKDYLEKHFDIPVQVNNDANCFALGEQRFGCGNKCRSLVGITLGTGVGSGLILNGELHSGRNTGSGEIGELPYMGGHNFEYWCSSVFFEREYGISGKDAAQAAANGGSKALDIWGVYGRHVGNLVKAVLFAYDPEMVVFGGGISSAYKYFAPSMLAELATFPYPSSLLNLKIETSKLKDVAILGASAL